MGIMHIGVGVAGIGGGAGNMTDIILQYVSNISTKRTDEGGGLNVP
jgi:hypothetical protein